jgi:hypothetical protein
MMWLVVALILAASELLTGNFYALILAVVAGVVAATAQMGLIDPLWQITLFVALSVGAVALWRRRRPKVLQSEANQVNTGLSRWIGRELVLAQGIKNGMGRVPLDDTTWSVSGPDCEPGTHARIVDVQGTTFIVELTNNS